MCNTSPLNNTVELLFNHTFGRQEQQDIVYTPVWAYADQYEDGDMLDSGWLLLDYPHNNRECWYQSRSVRIDCDLYRPRFPKHQYNGKNITVKEIFPQRTEDLTLLPLKSIYDQYISRKGFSDLYDPFRWLSNRTSFLLFECQGEIVGFTKIRRYYWESPYDNEYMFPGEGWDNHGVAGIETVLHASTVPISAVTADLEIQWAIDQGASYVYLGAGYEQGSEYKSSFRGFEWWTGSEWSRLKKMYKKLCKRDSETKLISDLPSK